MTSDDSGKKIRKSAPAGSVVADRPGGLCATCIHAATCAHRLRHGEPVLFCNEFDDSSRRQPDTIGPEHETREEYQGFKGLCMNCDHRLTCARSRSEGGVWHCEEYS